ncbi:hypothetical protein [Kineococcus radiotolerans]|uniref:Uncharacterized protein n=1 Tax=Kineococcus radiotolerans (strain ATCC BAA-149 / DSM 14245 / SRS30216) TaxID=266940 RepID=A6WGB1_KINRD|nr:hypothetical protein [Kineococcus radiotolerans]ABS05850.1 hypothetical protein Krad_4388 [Kineococcus radiotolerans SRS30216 = ATCC BAA-149]
MPETLLQRASDVADACRAVRAHRLAMQDAERLRRRTQELSDALTRASDVVQRWRVYRDGNVSVTPLPPCDVLQTAFTALSETVTVGGETPDDLFIAVRNALSSFTTRLSVSLDEAWQVHAQSQIDRAGITSAGLLPLGERRALGPALRDISAAAATAPSSAVAVRWFNELIDDVTQRLTAARVSELPAGLRQVVRSIDSGGLSLNELSEQDLRDLKERGYAAHLQVRWSAS